MVHYGQATDVLATKQRTMDEAYLLHPERFVKGSPRLPTLLTEAWINREKDKTACVLSR
jgi:putative transposase